MNSRVYIWYLDNQQLIDTTIDKILTYIQSNVIIYNSIPYTFYIKEHDMKNALINLFYVKNCYKLR